MISYALTACHTASTPLESACSEVETDCADGKGICIRRPSDGVKLCQLHCDTYDACPVEYITHDERGSVACYCELAWTPQKPYR